MFFVGIVVFGQQKEDLLQEFEDERKEKTLRLKKHVIANLRTFKLKGGTGSFPCVPTGPNPSDTCPTYDGYTCPEPCDPDTTREDKVTSPLNTCDPIENGGLQTGPGCP